MDDTSRFRQSKGVTVTQTRLHKAFGQALRHLRGEAHLSQEELADRSGLHRTYISQLERGLKSPSLSAIEAIAAALGQRPHLLIKAAEDLEQ